MAMGGRRQEGGEDGALPKGEETGTKEDGVETGKKEDGVATGTCGSNWKGGCKGEETTTKVGRQRRSA